MSPIEQAKRKITQWWNTPCGGVLRPRWYGSLYSLLGECCVGTGVSVVGLKQALKELHAEVRLNVDLRTPILVALERYPDRQNVVNDFKQRILKWRDRPPFFASFNGLRASELKRLCDLDALGFWDAVDALEQLHGEGKIIFSYGEVPVGVSKWDTVFNYALPGGMKGALKKSVLHILGDKWAGTVASFMKELNEVCYYTDAKSLPLRQAMDELVAEGKITYHESSRGSGTAPLLIIARVSTRQTAVDFAVAAVASDTCAAEAETRRHLRRWMRKFFDENPGKAWTGNLYGLCRNLAHAFPHAVFNEDRVWKCLRAVRDSEIAVDMADDKSISIRSRLLPCTGILCEDIQDRNVRLGRKDIHDRSQRPPVANRFEPSDVKDRVFKCRVEDLLALLQQVAPSKSFKAERLTVPSREGDQNVVRLSTWDNGQEIQLRDIPEELPKAEALQ